MEHRSSVPAALVIRSSRSWGRTSLHSMLYSADTPYGHSKPDVGRMAALMKDVAEMARRHFAESDESAFAFRPSLAFRLRSRTVVSSSQTRHGAVAEGCLNKASWTNHRPPWRKSLYDGDIRTWTTRSSTWENTVGARRTLLSKRRRSTPASATSTASYRADALSLRDRDARHHRCLLRQERLRRPARSHTCPNPSSARSFKISSTAERVF